MEFHSEILFFLANSKLQDGAKGGNQAQLSQARRTRDLIRLVKIGLAHHQASFSTLFIKVLYPINDRHEQLCFAMLV